MKILAKTGREDLAIVYVAETESGKRIEFVESVQPPLPREKKWVLIISSLFGCCVGCTFCDAGGNYQGKLSKDELFAQIDFLIRNRYPDGEVPVEKLKIQFARMGEPALNMNVIDVLQEFHSRYNAPGFMPSVSTVAPAGTDRFFDELLKVKNEIYKEKFQLQFSIHTTDQQLRNRIIPVRKWDFRAIADYGQDFYEVRANLPRTKDSHFASTHRVLPAQVGSVGNPLSANQSKHRKITLNFALADSYPLEPAVLLKYFSPERFLIKITPVNPSYKAVSNELSSENLLLKNREDLICSLKELGYDVILSIGELEENNIGSNCGQYLENYEKEKQALEKSYTYRLQPV